ncbi:alpha-1,3-mannosyl-glycoprotein 2-beta-N-acetylglucosaminyltransferase [Copidosoma floridanum]|uniref:alpha-1,3-mannosyl-glycoprotein 2-beta-N-acetylglucosaminyltransferase n=1 Tax=Copidosoma floridanum TaxID=29053 RepID=UPI0006C9E574|nr:alpha-1,3-mannosyl-glycoprotein 2-beta-N-acetylglucosaminyltransferase [Copidosoma floridanum]
MRSKYIVFVLVSLVIWTTVSFIFILHQYPTKINKVDFSLQITKLENEVSYILSSNQKVFRNREQLRTKNSYEDYQTSNVFSREILLSKNRNALENQVRSSRVYKEYLNTHQREDILKVQYSSNKTYAMTVRTQAHNISKEYPVVAVLVISCNRITVKRCLDQLIKFRPHKDMFPIIVSHDCNHRDTSDVIKRYDKEIIYMQQPDQSEIEIPPIEKKFSGYFKIARHYGWALNQTFFKFNFEAAIVVEDDLDISPDFYEYFLSTYPLLKEDPSLWCISAWNDNGKSSLIDLASPHLLYRTDFFPGLGWMLTQKLWFELSHKWPKSYWDDWIRQPEQRQNRACIRPEISRTRTFGKFGVSNGLFFEKHLKFIELNNKKVDFSKHDLKYLLKENYDAKFIKKVYQLKEVNYLELNSNKLPIIQSEYRISYDSRQSYKNIARMFGLMDDFKSGVPRTGYHGIVTFYLNHRRIFLAPRVQWTKYDLAWS